MKARAAALKVPAELNTAAVLPPVVVDVAEAAAAALGVVDV
jgi:hypothetical protein